MSPDFRDYLNDQQLVLAEAHNNIASNWFAHD
jgi:hypothetical protein